MMRPSKRFFKEEKEIGKNIAHFRKARGWSRSKLAQMVGVTHQQIGKYEKGTNRLSVTGLKRICEALGVTFADVMECPVKKEDEITKAFYKIKTQDLKKIVLSHVRNLARYDARR